mgnify:CR=1 FL=1
MLHDNGNEDTIKQEDNLEDEDTNEKEPYGPIRPWDKVVPYRCFLKNARKLPFLKGNRGYFTLKKKAWARCCLRKNGIVPPVLL